ncbi:UNVERIFIED_CONTAM: hypothetical protein RMT77_009662 [Armadillidium vulgare]
MTADDAKQQKSNPKQKKVYTLKVLTVVREAQLTHGLRHNDYQLYRQYCTRRLRRIRKNLAFVQGDRKNFRRKEVNSSVLKDEKFLYIPLVTVERCWAYAMQLKEESLQDPRKKFSMRNKLRKASKYVVAFEKLVEGSPNCDARTQLEVQGYSSWLQGTVLFEMAEFTGQWEEPVEFFNKAHAIYSKLEKAVSEDEVEIYKQRLQELEVKLRYCRHHLGDKAATDKLLSMRGNEALGAKLDKLLASARERQASTLSEVSWKGRTLAVKHEKVRLFLLNEGLIHEELTKTSKPEERVEMLDKLLMDCKDSIQIIREDLKNDPSFKPRQASTEGPVTPLHFLHTYLSYLRLNLTILRNLALYHSYCDIINGKKKVEDGKKAPKIQDVVRLCDLILQNLNEIPTLAGLEKLLEIKENLEGQKIAYKAHRSFCVAEHYAKLEKWPEALALYGRTDSLINKTEKYELEKSLKESLNVLKNEVESKKYTAHAQVLLSKQQQGKIIESPKISEEDKNKMLIDRLDLYMEDESLLSKNPKVAPVPPEMESVPCKPLFFDLALNHVDFPSLEDKEQRANSPAKQQQVGGIRGLVKGLWGWGS